MKITLCVIAGNEEANIERFIRSFSDAFDALVLVSAIGNQEPDHTLQIAGDLCGELGKEFFSDSYLNDTDVPHVDHFGKARQMAWKIAQDNCDDGDYLFWADCDDVLALGAAQAIRDSADGGEYDVLIMPYHVKGGGKQIVWRERMARKEAGTYWRYPIHEQVAFTKDVKYKLVKDAIFVHSPQNVNGSKSERNLTILKRETYDSARNFFYMAQEYFHRQDHKNTIKAAKAALACPGLETLERYELYLQLAQTPGNDSKEYAAKAYALMPDRREALALLANYSILDGNYETALELASAMMALKLPNKTYWSMDHDWYGWKGEELNRHCLRLNGKAQEAEADFMDGTDPFRPIISIIHATLDRPEKALAIRDMWLSRANHPENVDYVFGLHEWDTKSIQIFKGFRHTITPGKGPAVNYDTAAGITLGSLIVQAQDDCYPPQGWDDALLAVIPDPSAPAFVATNDGTRKDRLSVNTIITRAYMEIKAVRDPGENGFFPRSYITVFADTENSYRAVMDDAAGICQYIDARDSITIQHDHPYFNAGVPWDETYEFENSKENYALGAETFGRRNPNANLEILNNQEVTA